MSYLRNSLYTTLVSMLLRSLFAVSDIRAKCRTIPGIASEQLDLCYRAYDVTSVALDGLDLAVHECQHQFFWHRWNCSSLSTRRRNPHSSSLLKKGYRESAFAYAVSSAGVAYSVARACSQGRLVSCGCDSSVSRYSLSKYIKENANKRSASVIEARPYDVVNLTNQKKLDRLRITTRWKWGGCSHNLEFGIEFSELFLDSREKAGDIQSKINLHNNRAGRMALANNMQIRCKCHGMSGSCQLKTCWRSAPDFGVVGNFLKHMFRQAVLVDQSNLGSGAPLIIAKSSIRAHKRKYMSSHGRPRHLRRTHGANQLSRIKQLENSLFYYQRSPNFCVKDPTSDIQGTIGRRCNRTGTGSGTCGSMCCGRGYNLIRESRLEQCNCKFHWCCFVECDNCMVEEWISICN